MKRTMVYEAPLVDLQAPEARWRFPHPTAFDELTARIGQRVVVLVEDEYVRVYIEDDAVVEEVPAP